MTHTRIPRIALALFALAVGLWVAADGRHHWDEPSYLYAGAYVDADDVIGGQVQPSGIGHFTQGRILHALIVKGVMAVAGSPPAGFFAMLAINLVLLGASLILLYRILRALLPGVAWTREATALVAMSPVILYLAFRVLADAEALCAALLSTFALLRLAQGGSLPYAGIAIAGIAACTLSKNQMAWIPATFWATFCLVPVAGLDRRRLLVLGAVSGIAAIVVTVGVLEWLGVGLEAYWSSYRSLASGDVPLVAKAVNIGTELGVLWLLLPFSLLTTRRSELLAFAAWFVLAMAPFVFVINSIEARHVVVNLVAVGGLFALALEALANRWRSGWRDGENLAPAAALLAIVVVMATNTTALAIMPHRVDRPQLRKAIDALDARFGAGGYVLLTATGYTDFHMIRVLWPKVDVRDASTADTYVHAGSRSRKQALEAWYGGRAIESVEVLSRVDKPVAYLGYRQTFAAENLRDMLARVSPAMAGQFANSVKLPDRLFSPATQWLWGNARVTFEPVAEIGHYLAYEVRIAPPRQQFP